MTDTSKPTLADDAALADILAPVLWEADEWWKANYEKLEPTADWAECVLLHMLPKLRAALATEAFAKFNASLSTGATVNSASAPMNESPTE